MRRAIRKMDESQEWHIIINSIKGLKLEHLAEYKRDFHR